MSCKWAALGFYQEEGVANSAWDSTPSRLAPLPGLGPQRTWKNVCLLCVVIGPERRAHCWLVSVLALHHSSPGTAPYETPPSWEHMRRSTEGWPPGSQPHSPRPPAWATESPSKPLATGDPVGRGGGRGPTEKWPGY